MHGRGFFSSIGNAISRGNQYLKDNKTISTLAGALADNGIGGQYTKSIADIAGKMGYGLRRHRVHGLILG